MIPSAELTEEAKLTGQEGVKIGEAQMFKTIPPAGVPLAQRGMYEDFSEIFELNPSSKSLFKDVSPANINPKHVRVRKALLNPLGKLFIRSRIAEEENGLILNHPATTEIRVKVEKKEKDGNDLKADRLLIKACAQISIHGNILLWGATDGSRKASKQWKNTRYIGVGLWLGLAVNRNEQNDETACKGHGLGCACDIDSAELCGTILLLTHALEWASARFGGEKPQEAWDNLGGMHASVLITSREHSDETDVHTHTPP